MVAPVVVGAARVATTAAKAGGRAGAKTVQSSIARNRAARKKFQNVPGPKTPTGNDVHVGRALRRRELAGKAEEGHRAIKRNLGRIPFAGKKLRNKYKKTLVTKKRTKAFVRCGFIAASLVPLYGVQLFFAILFFIALGAAANMGVITEWLYGDIAEMVAMVSWVILILLGIINMLYAAIMLAVFLVPVWRHPNAVLMFAVCVAGYFAPALFFFPWVFLWLAVVTWVQE